MKGKAVAQPQDEPMLIDPEAPDSEAPDSEPSEPNIADLIKQGKLSQASQFVFSAGALEMLENGKFSRPLTA